MSCKPVSAERHRWAVLIPIYYKRQRFLFFFSRRAVAVGSLYCQECAKTTPVIAMDRTMVPANRPIRDWFARRREAKKNLKLETSTPDPSGEAGGPTAPAGASDPGEGEAEVPGSASA